MTQGGDEVFPIPQPTVQVPPTSYTALPPPVVTAGRGTRPDAEAGLPVNVATTGTPPGTLQAPSRMIHQSFAPQSNTLFPDVRCRLDYRRRRHGRGTWRSPTVFMSST